MLHNLEKERSLDLTIQSNQGRLIYLDWFRVIACIAVVTIHVTAGAIFAYMPQSTPQLLVTMVNGLVLFAVPAFIAVSGYALMAVYEKRNLKFTSFFKKRILSLFAPYFLWSIVYYFVILQINGGSFEWKKLIFEIATGSACYHLYFMPLIFQFYLLFIPLRKIVNLVDWKIIIPITFLLHYVYTTFWKMYIPLSDRVFLSYLVFFLFGMVMGKYHKQVIPFLLRHVPLILAGYGISLYFQLSDRIHQFVFLKNTALRLPFTWEIFSLFSIIIVLLLSWRIDDRLRQGNTISLLSSITFDVYLAHPLVLMLLSLVYPRFGVESISVMVVINFLLGILLPSSVSLFMKRVDFKSR